MDGALTTLYAGTDNGVAVLSNYALAVTDVPAPATHASLALSAAPNPVRGGGVRLSFAMSQAGKVRLTVYGLDGRLLRELTRGLLAAGAHSLAWDARDGAGAAVSPGIYFARLETADVASTTRIVVLAK